MSQIALPLATASGAAARRIVAGNANAGVLDAFAHANDWPFRSAVLFGPRRSGKSLLALWFGEHGGQAIDNADAVDETVLFHQWNRAQENGQPLLFVSGRSDWSVALPDLASRLGAALRLQIGAPDDAMMADLLTLHAERRGLVLDANATSYLVPRVERSHLTAERLVAAIDRLSLERKQPPGLAIWREAVEEVARSHPEG